MKDCYFVQEWNFDDESPDSSTMGKAIISHPKHYECIVVYGVSNTLTERVIKIIAALNGE